MTKQRDESIKTLEVIEKLYGYYNKASVEQIETGGDWYQDAHDSAIILAMQHNLPLFKVCGVIAALSPRNKWERNLYDTDNMLANPSVETKTCTFKTNRRKAIKILEAADESIVKDILNGEKTRAFFDNILYPETSVETTVDVWMYRAANLGTGVVNYRIVKHAVEYIALQETELPMVIQAVIWGVIRDGVNNSSNQLEEVA